MCDDPEMPWALDLDGVVWRAAAPIPGADAAVRLIRDAGDDVVFVTNNSAAPILEQEAKLASIGIDASGAVISSATAAASLVRAGERVLVCGGPGVIEAVEGAGGQLVDAGPADVVIVGLKRDFGYSDLTVAMNAVRDGARLIGTNHDPTFPIPDGLEAGGGALVAAVAAAAETPATYAGKPNPPAAELVRRRLGPEGICVGDRPDSDGLFARALGYEFGLVLTGVVSEEDLPVTPAPDHVAADLLALVTAVLG